MKRAPNPQPPVQRLRVSVRGAVQGVGFRPFVFRLATGLALHGWVSNDSRGVLLEVEGPTGLLERFLAALHERPPARAHVQGVETALLDPRGYRGFEIRPSDASERKTVLVLPDIATCDDCLAELFDPADRRHRYPFINCTHCGPRFSIIERLPYDRAATTMRRFVMCAACAAEYADPRDRRFHAQPNACADCGPQVELWRPDGRRMAERDEALRAAAAALRDGGIVAVKGIGGFHLMVDARSRAAVQRLRERKQREEKPLALMLPSLETARAWVRLGPGETRLLRSPEAPILLAERVADPAAPLAEEVAPGNPALGVMLPYTPLHHLLLAELGFPLVATSGNRSDEPICTREDEALRRLAGIADLLLVHDRPIARHVDDSVVRVVAGRPLLLRRARGYAPLPLPLPRALPPTLAVGGQLKSAVALAVERDAFVSQHLGDLETAEALEAFERCVEDLPRLYETAPRAVVCDRHPDYPSTIRAERSGLPLTAVQHHFAHVAACMADNELSPPVLGVSWDGTGYGDDGTVWGGEFLWVDGDGWRRVAHLRAFALPGGERAVKEPRRSALGLLFELFGAGLTGLGGLPPVEAFEGVELRALLRLLGRAGRCPRTSSAGRLFDAVAALLGLRQTCRFEGQAAMELEWIASRAAGGEGVAPVLRESPDPAAPLVVDWEPLVRGLLEARRRAVAVERLARGFHDGLAQAVTAVARRTGAERVVLTGGCFQNRLLTESAISRLREAGLRPYWHQRVPPNDGGIALGQLVALALRSDGGATPPSTQTP